MIAGAWRGAVLAALVLLAYGSSFEAATLGGGERIRAWAIFAGIAAGALVGLIAGAIGTRRRR